MFQNVGMATSWKMALAFREFISFFFFSSQYESSYTKGFKTAHSHCRLCFDFSGACLDLEDSTAEIVSGPKHAKYNMLYLIEQASIEAVFYDIKHVLKTSLVCLFNMLLFIVAVYKLIAVVVSPAGGALLLILVIALIVTCCK